MNMKTMNISRMIILVLIALTLATGQTTSSAKRTAGTTSPASSKPPTELPSAQEVEDALKRTFGYDPSISWQVYDIRKSEIPGLAEILVSVNKNAPSHIYYLQSAQSAIIGNLIPFGPNPFAPARAKLQAADGPSRGASAPVINIVEFSDLECPHCKLAQPILEKLAADFPQVRYTFQQFPLPASLHPWAMKGAEYADCAAQTNKDAFWKYIDSIFENQGGIALATADDKLKELATAAGLDAEKIAACAATPATEARVKKSMDLGHSLEVNETPTVFINGRRVSSVATIPYEQLKALVQFEIDHAGK
jgi:protein-disulfide isomerase